MRHELSAAIALALCVLLAPAAFSEPAGDSTVAPKAAAAHKAAHHKHVAHKFAHKRRVSRHWRGYGFLPGYVPPELAEREREWRYWESQPHFLRPAWPRFYRGRWNGGGFGPCYVYTPIGYMWTCGR